MDIRCGYLKMTSGTPKDMKLITNISHFYDHMNLGIILYLPIQISEDQTPHYHIIAIDLLPFCQNRQLMLSVTTSKQSLGHQSAAVKEITAKQM